MKKGILIAILVGSALLVTGAVVFAVGVANSPREVEVTNTHQLQGTVTNFNISEEISDIVFEASTDGSQKVICNESEKLLHTVSLTDSTLNIAFKDERKWYEHIFNFNTIKYSVKIYLPAGEYNNLTLRSHTGDVMIPQGFTFNNVDMELSTGDVNLKANVNELTKVKVSTGNINLNNMTTKTMNVESSTGHLSLNNVAVTGDINLKASTGNMSLNNVTGDNLTINSSTGHVTLTNTVIAKHIQIETSTGNVKFEDSDADTLDIKTTTGDVKGTLLTSKIFHAYSKTGDVNVPKTTTGGLCEINTKTGDINITIKNS